MIIIIVLVLVLILLAAWGVTTQNRLVHADESCGNAMSQIGIQQASRWDALTSLVQQVKKYSQHEYSALQDITAQRQSINAGTGTKEADEQNILITQLGNRLMAVAESYPDLKSAGLYQEVLSGINKWEDNVRYSRMSYNDTATKMNRIVRSFPTSLIAGMLGFGKREYLSVDEGKTQMPDLS